MKKIVALALCLVMVIGLMTGCQKKMDADTLYQKMNEAMKAVTAQSMDMEMDLEMKVSSMGITMTMGLGMNGKIQAKADLSAMHMDMIVNMEAVGQSEEISMEAYMALEGDALTSYVCESESDTWVKSTMSGFEELAVESQKLAEELGLEENKMPKGTLTLAEEQITVNDRKCYVLTQQLGGEELQSFMSEYMDMILTKAMEEAEEEPDAETQEAMEIIKKLDWSKMSYNVVYHVDAETFMPLENEVELLGLGETMNGMIETLLAEAMVEMDEEMPAFSVDFPTCKLVMKNMTYNEAVEIPDVPQEAIDNAIDADEMVEDEFVVDESLLNNPAQADGSYLLTCEGDSVSIRIPEGYIPVMSELDNLEIMTPDYLNSGNYALVEEVTDEYLREYVNEMLTYAQEGEYYLSHTEPAELNGFTVATQIYNDGTGAVYAWRQLDATVLLVEVFFTGESFDTEALLSGLEIIAE